MTDRTYYERAARAARGRPQPSNTELRAHACVTQQAIADSVARGDWPERPWAESFTARFVEQIRDCVHFVDVGAGAGFYTLLALRHMPAGGRVTAVEPDPLWADLLRQRCAGDRVDILEAAAADHRGRQTLAKPPGCSATAAQVPGATFEVPTVVLDEHLSGVAVDVIKIDVEGGEAGVINGLRQVLSRGTVRLFVEYHPWIERVRGGGTELLRRRFAEAAYRVYRTDGGGLQAVDRPGGRMVVVPAGWPLEPCKESCHRA